MIGASPGSFGGIWAHAETRRVLGLMGARVVEAELSLGKAHERLAEPDEELVAAAPRRDRPARVGGRRSGRGRLTASTGSVLGRHPGLVDTAGDTADADEGQAVCSGLGVPFRVG